MMNWILELIMKLFGKAKYVAISGTVTLAGQPAEGITVYYRPDIIAVTDSKGYYRIDIIPAGTAGKVFVNVLGWKFTPPYYEFTNIRRDKIVNFVGTESGDPA